MWVIVQACDNPTGSSGLTLTNTMLCSFLEKPCGPKGGGERGAQQMQAVIQKVRGLEGITQTPTDRKK